MKTLRAPNLGVIAALGVLFATCALAATSTAGNTAMAPLNKNLCVATLNSNTQLVADKVQMATIVAVVENNTKAEVNGANTPALVEANSQVENNTTGVSPPPTIRVGTVNANNSKSLNIFRNARNVAAVANNGGTSKATINTARNTKGGQTRNS